MVHQLMLFIDHLKIYQVSDRAMKILLYTHLKKFHEPNQTNIYYMGEMQHLS